MYVQRCFNLANFMLWKNNIFCLLIIWERDSIWLSLDYRWWSCVQSRRNKRKSSGLQKLKVSSSLRRTEAIIIVVSANRLLPENVHVVDALQEALVRRQDLHALDVLLEFLHVPFHFRPAILEPRYDLWSEAENVSWIQKQVGSEFGSIYI